jgi:hypothetical protein
VGVPPAQKSKIQISKFTGFINFCGVGSEDSAVGYILPSLNSAISDAENPLKRPVGKLSTQRPGTPSIFVAIATPDLQLRMLVQSGFKGNKINLPQPALRIRFSSQKMLHDRVEHWHHCAYLYFLIFNT